MIILRWVLKYLGRPHGPPERAPGVCGIDTQWRQGTWIVRRKLMGGHTRAKHPPAPPGRAACRAPRDGLIALTYLVDILNRHKPLSALTAL